MTINIETEFGVRTVALRSSGRVDLLDASATPPRWVDWVGEVDALEELGVEFVDGGWVVRFLGQFWVARDRAGRELASGFPSHRAALSVAVTAHLRAERRRACSEGRDFTVVRRAEEIVARCAR